jgi:hypothetical protein
MKKCICSIFLLFAPVFFGDYVVAQRGSQPALASPLDSARGMVAVLIFVRTDCPISNRYAPTIERLSAQNAANTKFFLVFPDRSETSSSLQKYTSDFGYAFSAIRDPQHLLVKRAHARFTPEAAVFDRKGFLVYHGRIDNQYQTFGRARPVPTTHELQDAIHAALNGRAPDRAEVPGVGCSISDLE